MFLSKTCTAIDDWLLLLKKCYGLHLYHWLIPSPYSIHVSHWHLLHDNELCWCICKYLVPLHLIKIKFVVEEQLQVTVYLTNLFPYIRHSCIPRSTGSIILVKSFNNSFSIIKQNFKKWFRYETTTRNFTQKQFWHIGRCVSIVNQCLETELLDLWLDVLYQAFAASILVTGKAQFEKFGRQHHFYMILPLWQLTDCAV